VKSWDTNAAVRLLVEDDPAQCERAERAFRRAIDGGGVFFSATVLVEVAWVLRVACKQDRTALAGALPQARQLRGRYSRTRSDHSSSARRLRSWTGGLL